MFALVAAVTDSGGQTTRRVRQQRNRPPTIQSFTASTSQIIYCPFDPNGICSPSGTIATLQVQASDPDNDPLTYTYSVTGGTVSGTGGETANWDLFDARFAMQTATVEVTDQRGGKASSVVRVDVVMCGTCDPPRPSMGVTCPYDVIQGEIAVFTLNISLVDPDKLTYLWRHSNGKRLPGQEGPQLKIKAIGRPGEIISATVTVLGLDPSFNRTASCETRIEKLP